MTDLSAAGPQGRPPADRQPRYKQNEMKEKCKNGYGSVRVLERCYNRFLRKEVNE